MLTDDQLFELLGKNAELFAAYEEWANAQIMLLAGTVDDPNSFNEAGGKTGVLGYYPVVNVSGQTIYVPCQARLMAIALGGSNAGVLEQLLAQVSGKLVTLDAAIAQSGSATALATEKAGLAGEKAALAGQTAAAAQAVVDAGTAILAARDEAVAAAAGYRLVAYGGTGNAILANAFPPRAMTSGQLVTLQPNQTNTGPVTIAIDGKAAIPVYGRDGSNLLEGQLQAGHYIARIAGAGATLQIIILMALEAPVQSAGPATDGSRFMTPRRTVPLISRARRIVDGRVYALTNNLDGSIKISVSQGRIWDENSGGAPAYRVNGVADVVLTANRALVVDLDGLLDSNARLTPVVVNLGSVGSIGWQTGNWVVLFSHTTSSAGQPVDQIYGGGAYRLNLPVAAVDTSALEANIRRARYSIVGRVYALAAAPNKLTISTSQGRVYVEGGGSAPTYKIEAATNVELANNTALMVDLDSALNAAGRVVPYVGVPGAAANSGWQSGNKLVLFSNANTDTGLPVDQIYGGGPYTLNLPVPVSDTTALATSLLRARRIVDGRIYKLVNNGNGTVTVSISQGRVWRENAAGSIEYRIDGMTDVVLGAQQAIVANLDDQAVGSTVRVVPTVVSNLASGANSGWQSGNKLVIFSHTTSGASPSPLDQIYGGGAYRLEPAVTTSITRDNTLVVAKVAPTNGGIGSMNIYVPGAKSRWTGWRFLRSVNTDLSKGPKVDVWRNAGQYDVSLDASYFQTVVAQLTRPSEIETAVMQPGRADYSGGVSHGNQVMSEFRAFADGIEFDPAVAATITAKELTFYQTSALFDNAAPDTKIADVYTHWRWTVKGLRLEVTMVIAGTQTFSYIYAGIFPVFRANEAGQWMVLKGRRSPPRLGQYEEDLSTATYNQFNSKANELVGYGNGYVFRARKLAGYDDATAPNRTTYFAPTVDNKFYFNQISAANPQTFADGTVIGPVVTEFEILNPN